MNEPNQYSPQRAFPRWPAHLDVRYGDEEQISSGEGLDVSEGGLAFRGRALYPSGKEIELAFRLESPEAAWIRVRAVVRYASQNRIGVEFMDVPSVVRETIRRDIAHDQGRPEAGN